MVHFIPLSDRRRLDSLAISLDRVGKSTGILGLGTKVYLMYDEAGKEWGVQCLNLWQRILRALMGWYQETHKETVKTYLQKVNTLPLTSDAKLLKRMEEIWNVHLSGSKGSEKALQSGNDDEDPFLQIPLQDVDPRPVKSSSNYCIAERRFDGIYQEAIRWVDLLRASLVPGTKKNIQNVCLFGDWKEMGYDLEAFIRYKHTSTELTQLETIASKFPELGNFAFINVRGNGECGYRSLLIGLIFTECLAHERSDDLQKAFEQAYQDLAGSWSALSFQDQEKSYFKKSLDQSIVQLDRLKQLDKADRIKLLMDEEEFLPPFLSLIRCLIVSQTKALSMEGTEALSRRLHENRNTLLNRLEEKAQFNEEEVEYLSYAVQNYLPVSLLGDAQLEDLVNNDKQNADKVRIQEIAKRSAQADLSAFQELFKTTNELKELSTKEDILAAPLPEMIDLDVDLEEFLRRKALAKADSPVNLWALGSDFAALGLALGKNICCIYGNHGTVQKAFHDRPPVFYGLNMNGKAHYNVLLPLTS